MSPRRKRGGRPPIADREAVRSRLVTLKLSPTERDLLDRLIEARAIDLRAETSGARIEVTASSYLRWLLMRDAEVRQLVQPSEHEPRKKRVRTTRKDTRGSK